MPQKSAFVSSLRGEVTVAANGSEVMVGVDLHLPNVAPFVVRTSLDGTSDAEVTFRSMFDGVWCLVKTYFIHQGVSETFVLMLGESLINALSTLLDPHPDVRKSLYGGVPLTERRVMEGSSFFEAEFDIPAEFLDQVYGKVVTASTVIRRTPTPQPRPTQTAPQTKIVQRPVPSLKQVIQRFRGNQPTKAQPLYVIVYDSCGRPAGVRPVKAQGVMGLSGRIASTLEGVLVNPTAKEFKALQAQEGSEYIRGFLDPTSDTLRLWDGYALTFDQVRAEVGLTDGIPIMIWPEGVVELATPVRRQNEAVLRASGALRQLLGPDFPIE